MSQKKKKMPRKRMLSFMLALCMMLTTLPAIPLWAAEDQTESANVTMNKDVDNAVDEDTDETEAVSGTVEETPVTPEGKTINPCRIEDSEDSDAIESEQDEKMFLVDEINEAEARATVESIPIFISSGNCGKYGDNVKWRLEETTSIYYTLDISGIGEMGDYKTAEDYPWNNFRSKISRVVIGDDVTSIGMYAFWKCTSLTDVTIPARIANIGDSAFAGCTRLKAIKVDEQNTAYIDKDGIIFNKNETAIVCYPAGKSDSSYTVPESVTSIGYQAFYGNTSLNSVKIPDTVTTIKGYAFGECSNLCDIKIPNSATNIEWAVFYMCSSLTSITIPANMTSIEYAMFYKCTSLHDVIIPADVTHIGDSAFGKCNVLFDVYYGGSKETWEAIDIEIGNEPLTDAKLHYNSPVAGYPDTVNPTPSKSYKVYTNDGYEKFDCSLEECMKKTDSIEYNPQLAHMLIAMCNSVHEEEKMRKTFEEFGFDDNPLLDYSMDNILLAYAIGKKQMENGKTLVLVVARGTGDPFPGNDTWDPFGWASNIFDSAANKEGQHSGFSDAAKELYIRMTKFLGSEDFSKMEFVLTGHSRGAAAVNIMSARMQDKRVQQENFYPIYTYTFACPDTAVITKKKAHTYSSIFNIANARDPVSWVPRSILVKSGMADGWGKDSYWDKYGRSYWYCEEGYSKHSVSNKIPISIANFIKSGDQHDQKQYLQHLRVLDDLGNKRKFNEYYADREKASTLTDLSLFYAFGGFLEGAGTVSGIKYLRFIGFLCPVDVEIYDSNGQIVGKVMNNVADEKSPDRVHIYVEGDKKFVYLLDNEEYTFNLTGTDDGIMEFFAKEIDAGNWKVANEKIFTNVKLAKGKRMASSVKGHAVSSDSSNAKTSDIQLIVLNNNGEAEKQVLSDGKGTEVPLKTVNAKIKKLKITGSSKRIAVGKKLKLKVSISPTNATNKTVAWKSSNTKYATINNKGVVTIKKAAGGKTVTITAMAKDGSGIKVSYEIQCMKGVVKKVTISGKKTRTIEAGKSIKLKAAIKATKGANKTLKWSCSNTKYAKANSKGKVTTKEAGKGKTVKITAIATDGSKKKTTIKIRLK